jgi:hypothetical protein
MFVLAAAAAAVLANPPPVFILLLAAAAVQVGIIALAAAVPVAHTAPAAVPVTVQVAVAVAVAVAQWDQAAKVTVAVAVAVSGLLVTQTRLGLAVRGAPALRLDRAVVVTPHLGVQPEVLPALAVFMAAAARAALHGMAAVVAGAAVRCVLLLPVPLGSSPTQTSKVYFGDRSWISNCVNTQS